MADGSCSDGKTVANIINEKLIKSDENLFNYDKSICSDSVECANRKISASDIQKSGLKRDYNNIMTGAAVGTAANHNQQHQYENDINVQQQQQQHKYLSVTDAQASAGGGTSSNCKIELSNILSNAAAAATPSNNQLQKIQGASENCNNNNLKNNKIKMLSGNINNNSKNLCNSSTSSGATNNSAVLKNKNNNINKNSGLLISQKSMDSATSDMDTSKSEDNSSSSSNGGGSGGGAPEADDHRAKKKRCSDRYDSSESSDSGVATLSCTDSSTASSDASDPGSPYSPVSIGDDVHQSPKANMPPQTVLATQAQQQQQPQPIPQQHQWPWNTLNNTTTTTINNNNNNNNNNFSANNKNSVSNSVASSNKHKRISTNSSDNNGTAKKVRTTLNSTDKTQSAPPSAVKRLKTTTAAAIIEESQKKITGYFKSQMKPLNTLKKDISNLVALSTDIQPAATGLDKYFNILTKVKDDQNSKESKANSIKNNIEVDVRTLTTMPPSLKKIERKQTKVAQVAPISRKTAAGQQPKSPKKPVAIAPRTAELKKNTAAANQQQQHQLRKTPSNLQPTVLLTAIRIPQPGGNQQQVQTSQSHNTGSGNKVQASTKVGSVFQIPVMPNLVQIPNLLATNGTTNLVVNNGQLARVGNGAQYFLNGTVIKLQQFGNNGNGNSNNGGVLTMESGLSGNILVKPTTIAQAVPLTTTTSTKTTLPITQSQTPIVSHHQQQQQQPTLTTNVCSATAQQISGQNYGGANHHQRLAAQPVFMATTTGLLLNAALPAVLATTSKPPGLTQAIPALHPIQPATQSSNILPSLSTILQTHHHHHHHQTASTSQSIHHHHHHNQPAQFLVSQANAILSSIPETTLSNITPKLSHGLTAVTSIATSLISPVPPLVTLACAQASVSTKLAASIAQVKSSSSLLSIDTSESGIADSSSDESQMTDQKELKLKESLSLMIKPQFPDTNAIFDMLKNEPPTIPLQQIKIEELKPCLPSPKSLVLEQIKQKTPPDVFTDEGIKTETSSSSNSTDNDLSPSSSSDLKSTSIDIDIEEESSLPKSAISPILSQPKTIRFPALPGGESGCRFGPKGTKRHDGVCYWDNCNAKHDTSSKLLDHLQTHHANTQTGPFTCLWSGCKVHGRQSCSRRWLERHVLSHGGTKPFKCIVDGCGLRFGSQLALQKHVNGHFNTVESKDNPSKRASDPPVPKVLRKSGKKLRYRRQPFSARLFDFFDSGVMEGLQHRLMVTGSLANGPKGSVTFQGRPMARRTSLKGVSEVFMQWNPSEIIADEWIPETEAALTKTVAIHTLKNQEIIALQNYIGAANLNSDISTMFNQISTTTTIKATTLTTSSITSSSNINNNLQPTTRKQSRKPPKRIQPS